MKFSQPQDPSAHIGLCRFERAFDADGNPLPLPEGQLYETYEAPVACWSRSAQEFDDMATHLLPDQGYRLLKIEEVMPIEAWFEMKGFSEALGALSAKVHNGHRLEIGSLRSVGFEQSHGLEGATKSDIDAQGPLIITEHPITPLADQSAIPFWDREWISEDLKQLPDSGLSIRGEGPRALGLDAVFPTLAADSAGHPYSFSAAEA